jgi:hypothetical protein
MLLNEAFKGQKIPRAPSVPKIYLDLAANLLNRDFIDIFASPELAARTIIEAALLCECDGARVFLFPKREIKIDNGIYYHYKNNKNIGKLDFHGSMATICENSEEIDFNDPETMICHRFFNSRDNKDPIIRDKKDINRFRIPLPEEFEKLFGPIVENCIKTAGDTCCPIGEAGNGTLQFCIYMLGMENALVCMYSDPELIKELMDFATELIIAQSKFMIDKGVRILRLGDSAANMTVISPLMWRKFIKPQFTKICKAVHAYCDEAKIYCHICGNVLPVVSDLVETRIDCIAPLDPLGNFTIPEVRKIVGPDFMLMGGVNTLSFINKTEDEITKEAEQRIKDGFTNDGHFAVGSGCVVPRSAKAEVIRGLARASKNMRVS